MGKTVLTLFVLVKSVRDPEADEGVESSSIDGKIGCMLHKF